MKHISIYVIILLMTLSCQNDYSLKNKTRPTGYALGNEVKLQFEINSIKNVPDSIMVEILETKTKYVYSDFAQKEICDVSCNYILDWDGKKPDGSWPAGGRYYVWALIDSETKIYSDTVEFGLVD